MDAVASALIASISTLAGTFLGALVQRLATAKRERRDACGAFIAALIAHREQQNTKRRLIADGAGDDRLAEVRANRYATRTAVTSRRADLELSGVREDMLRLADQAIDRTYALADDLHTPHDLTLIDYRARRAAAQHACAAFQAAAARAYA